MRGIIIFLLWLLIACQFSCKKAEDNHATRLVKAMKIDSNACIINCLYDDQNRLLSATQCDTVESYIYAGDSIIYTRLQAGLLAYKYIYKLNSSGYVSGYTRIAADGSLSHFTDTYNADGLRTMWHDDTHDSTYRIYTIVDGNVASEFSKSSVVSQGNYTINSIFYTGTENTIGNINFGRPFLGTSSANLKKADAYDTPDGQFTVNYKYTLDYQNGVSKRVTTINGTVTETRYYEYY